jgi:hypothetical protein
MTSPETHPRVALLLRAIDQAYDRKSWHGPVLRGSLRGMTAADAAWRPGPRRHNVWEIALHAAYWKYRILRRLRHPAEIRFPYPGSDFFPRPEGPPSEAAWRADLKVLAEMHRDLRAAVAALTDAALDSIPEGSKTVIADLVLGIAYHDIYHAGQIQLLKRLREG